MAVCTAKAMEANKEATNDIDERLRSSHQDMVDMKSNLARLRGLSEQEKTENAMLQSRLDEQSQLIMILKRQSDEKGVKVNTLERINEELEMFRKQATEDIKKEISNYRMLDARFNDLAENHEQMIQIKDDYKSKNLILMKENAKLKEDNARLFSKAVQERDDQITELDKKVNFLKERVSIMDKKNKELMTLLKFNEEKMKEERNISAKNVQEKEERLKGSENKVKQLQEVNKSLEENFNAKLPSLAKERDEMLDLAMQRGKIVQEKVAENKKLQQKVEEMEKNVRDMQLKFERDAMAVNANLQVKRLRSELEETNQRTDELLREYDAYKKHTGQLLDKEKELNSQLRKLLG